MSPGQPAESEQPATYGSDDWNSAHDFLTAEPTKWNSLSWIAARTLIDSVNHVLADQTSSLVNDLRRHWTGGKDDRALRVDQLKASCFLVAGDPGEQDGSQYVVAPALSRAAAEQGVGFLLLLSDLIYPSGDVNDYVDGFYKPYRSATRPLFCIDKPIFAVPGNHDWYDGLYGFAYHFLPRAECDPVWPDLERAPTFEDLTFWKLTLDRFCRTMWRVPSKPSRETEDARAQTPHTGQPASYFVLDTAHLELVCIDTGIDGTVDLRQMQWLERLSQESRKPKILMTGKPLKVNGGLSKAAVSADGADSRLYALVTDPANHYVATVGGDVHNFQLYDDRDPKTQEGLVHLVSGGAGAYTHATHPIRASLSDARADLTSESEPEPNLFPGSAESLAYFAQQLVPSIWRMFCVMICFAAGVGLGACLAGVGWSHEVLVSGTSVVIGVGTAGALVSVGLLLVRIFWRSEVGIGRVMKSWLLMVQSLIVGMLATLFAYEQAPEHLERLLWLYLGCTAWICANAWGLRRSRWWSPVRKGSIDWWKHASFLLGALVLATAPVLAIAEDGDVGWYEFHAASAYALAALFGWYFRRVTNPSEDKRAAKWLLHSVWVASLVQALVVAGVMHHFLSDVGLVVLFWSGLSGIAVTAAIVFVLLLLPLLAGLPGLAVRSNLQRRRRWWRRVSKGTRWLVFLTAPLLLAGWAAAAEHSGSAWMKAAFGLPCLLVTLIGVALTVDFLRREVGPAYKFVVLVPLGVAIAVGLRCGYATSWPVTTATAAAFALLTIGAAVGLTHLVFLGAYRLIFDPGAHTAPRYRADSPEADLPFWSFISKSDARKIILAERERDGLGAQPADVDVDPKVRRRAEIAFPGLNPPFGPIQKFVSEIYSRDEPPFFKHFLRFETSPEEVTITIHKVRGDRPVVSERVVTISLPPVEEQQPSSDSTPWSSFMRWLSKICAAFLPRGSS